MIFADNDMVVVQAMLDGKHSVTVPTAKADALSDRLDDADILYEVDYDFANVDDTADDESTATVFMFAPDANVAQVQSILDDME